MVCGEAFIGSLEDSAAHMEAHGHTVERWPDGAPVVDASDAPELLESSDG